MIFYLPLLIISILLSDAILSSVAWAVGEYEVTDLGMISTYGSKAYCINDSGSAVGRSDASNTIASGFIWSAGNGMQTLLPLGGQTKAWAINNSGEIAGQYNSHAVLWSSAIASPTDLGDIGGSTSFAYGINNTGQVVGWADREAYSGYENTIYHAFVYSNGTMHDIGTLATDQGYYLGGYSLAYGANSSGRVVGVANTIGWYYHAFVWDATNGMTDLGTNPNHSEQEGYAVAINESGSVIAGCSKVTDTLESYPLLWLNSSTTSVLVSTLTAFPYAEFYSVNDNGQVVGLMWDGSDNQHAFLYDVHDSVPSIRDLNGMLPDGSGWQLTFAKSINEYGKIVGGGRYNNADHAFLLTPKIYFTSSVMSGSDPLYVCFTNTSITTPTSWQWNFGDGTYSTEKNPCHMYTTTGTYTVTLTDGSYTSTKNAFIDIASCSNSLARLVRTPSSTFSTIASALAAATQANDIVRAHALVRTEDLTWNSNRALTLSGGYLCDYLSNPGFTTVRSLTIASGTMTVENMIIQ
jgi:probable HAF family extracellular repeat protein